MKGLIAVVFVMLAAFNVASSYTALVRARERDAAVEALRECQAEPAPSPPSPSSMVVCEGGDFTLPPSKDCKVVLCSEVAFDFWAAEQAWTEHAAREWRLCEPPAP